MARPSGRLRGREVTHRIVMAGLDEGCVRVLSRLQRDAEQVFQFLLGHGGC